MTQKFAFNFNTNGICNKKGNFENVFMEKTIHVSRGKCEKKNVSNMEHFISNALAALNFHANNFHRIQKQRLDMDQPLLPKLSKIM